MSDILGIQPASRRDVVIIDDDPGVRDLLQDCLELDGFSVRPAADGVAGLTLIAQRRPACVVLDVMMPRLDGYSVLRLLREHHGFNLPVIMLTAAAEDDQAWRAWAGGVDCFMAKPFEVDALLHQLEMLSAASETPDEDTGAAA